MIIVARRFIAALLGDAVMGCSRNVEAQAGTRPRPAPPGRGALRNQRHACWREGVVRDELNPAAELVCGRTIERYGFPNSNGTGKSTRAVPSTVVYGARATATLRD